MAVEKWVAGSGVGLTWTASYTAAGQFNSIVNGNALMSDLNVVNGTNLDIFADAEVVLGSITSGAGAPYIGLYFYLLNSDGTTFGDGRFGSSAAGPPPAQYFVGSIPIVASVTQAFQGVVRGIVLPPGSGRFVLYNLTGATLAGASANTLKYRTYNRSVA